MKKLVRKTTKVLFFVFIISSVLILVANIWVVTSTKVKILTDYKDLPDSSVALVLGTSNKLSNGSPNPFFEDRILAAANLFRHGKASRFLLSGDNRTKYYNEPLEMKKALIKAGVPVSAITLDYAGLRTFDSIVRCKEIFGHNKIVIVTQPFHCYRALFISQFYEMDAVGLMTDSPMPDNSARVYVREYFARAKAILDLYFLNTTPKHLGNREPLVL